MTIQLMHYNFKLLQNELDSNNDKEFLPNQIDELLNQATRNIVRKYVHSTNDEIQQSIVDSLQVLYKDTTLVSGSSGNGIWYFDLPSDFSYFKRASVEANSCKNFDVTIYNQNFVQHALTNFNQKPSFAWGRCVGYLLNNQLVLHTLEDYTITDCVLTYVRKPAEMAFSTYNDITGTPKVVTHSDLPEELHDLIVRHAVMLAKGSVENSLGFQVSERLEASLS